MKEAFYSVYGAEDETRTRTGCRPPPPQDGVSTNSTTSAKVVLHTRLAVKMQPQFLSILPILRWYRRNGYDRGHRGGFRRLFSGHDRRARHVSREVGQT